MIVIDRGIKCDIPRNSKCLKCGKKFNEFDSVRIKTNVFEGVTKVSYFHNNCYY